MRFVLHMGPHKTGTSYIQMRLFREREELERRGWVYPDIATYGLFAQHDIAHNPDDHLQPAGLYAHELRQTIEKCKREGKNLILSSEGFRTWDAAQAAKLAGLMGVDKVELVYAIRCPFSVFYSYWAEEVKQGFSGSLPFRFMQNFIDPENSQILNPFFDLRRFEDDERFEINLIHFDAAQKRGIDICDLLTNDIMDCGALPPLDNTKVNESFPIELTEFLRLITFRHTHTKLFTDSRFRLAFTQNTSQQERDEIVATVADKAAESFRVVELPRDVPFYASLKERLAAKNYKRKLPAEGEQDLPSTPCRWRFADLGMLYLVPEVAALVEKYEQRMKEVGF